MRKYGGAANRTERSRLSKESAPESERERRSRLRKEKEGGGERTKESAERAKYEGAAAHRIFCICLGPVRLF